SVISASRKRVAASKKDRHSKIFTAQGARDRRVRLSIDISRKFFGLQDLLGYDKASKTLDWLFQRSMAAIKDLVEEMKHTSSSTLSDQCEQVFMEKGSEYLIKNGRKKKVAKCINGGKKKKKNIQEHKSRAHVDLATRSNCGNQVQSQSNHEVKIGEPLTQEKVPKPYSLLYNSQHNYVDLKVSRSKSKAHINLISQQPDLCDHCEILIDVGAILEGCKSIYNSCDFS
ncbi:hypothetical protein M8C21_001992, partial [Ambrosia artemisiifolia]